jgi:hypothetical protein
MDLTQYEVLMLAGALLGAVFKFHGDYTKLSARVRTIETDNTEFKNDMKILLAELQEIKLLLAKNQVN